MKTVLLAGAMLLAPAMANASVITNLGLDPTSATGAFDHSLGSLVGAFDDQYSFSLNHKMTVTIVSVTNVFAQRSDFISNFTGQVTMGASTVLGPVHATLGCISVSPCQSLAGKAVLGPGNYFLDITGFAHGTSGYGGNLATHALAATPLPAALPMFVGGLGLLAWFSRRRRPLDQA